MRNKLFKITVIAIMILLVCATVVNAYSFTATMTPSATYVECSKEFNIIIKISNLDVGTNGLNSISGYLEYDDDVFETVTESSIEGLNSWSASFNAENNKIVLTKTTFVKSEESVFQLTMKTKADVKEATKGAISFKNIIGSNSETQINAANISTEITIGTQPATDNAVNGANNTTLANLITVNNTSTTNNATNGSIVINVNTTNSSNSLNTTNANLANGVSGSNNVVNSSVNNVTYYSNSANSTSDSDMPYTGVTDYLVYIILAAVAVALVFYIKYQKIDRM